MEILSLGPVPYSEPCAQLGTPNYSDTAWRECQAFVQQLLRQFGEPPSGAKLRISRNPHDFGSYFDVEVRFNPDSVEAVDWAFAVEDGLPARWDELAQQELARTP